MELEITGVFRSHYDDIPDTIIDVVFSNVDECITEDRMMRWHLRNRMTEVFELLYHEKPAEVCVGNECVMCKQWVWSISEHECYQDG